MKGIPYIISAPSGAGKTTLCKMAEAHFPDIKISVSYTTRQPRPGEVNGRDYWFVDDAEFDRMIERGEFLEFAGVYGKRYGTSKKDLERLLAEGLSVILEIDVQGAAKVKQALSGGVYIFILPPSLKVCEERLVARGKDTRDDIQRRLRIAEEEIKRAPEYDYMIVNGDLQKAFDGLKAIMESETAGQEGGQAEPGAEALAKEASTPQMSAKLRELFGDILNG